MFQNLRLSGYFQIVALAALVLLSWRGLDIVSSGHLANPFGRTALAQDAADEAAAEMKPEAEAAAEEQKAPPAAEPETKRLTASDVKRMRSTDVTESMGKDGGADSSETVLMRLAERRAQIESLEEELNMRQRLIEAAEKRIDERIRELKAIEARIQQEAQAEPEDDVSALANLVSMYEGMKPKAAARIFNSLDMAVLVAVAEQIKPRTMSEIMAAMDAQAAQRLTLALARREAAAGSSAMPGELPEIGGGG